MQIAVLIEPTRPQGFRATAPTHPDVTAEGPTEDAAVQMLSERLSDRLNKLEWSRSKYPSRPTSPGWLRPDA